MKNKQRLKIQFLGAAETVTGSKYLLETANKKILIDCGLFQGLKELRMRNWEPLPFEVSSLDYVLLTHGHLDHVGYLPLLVKQGFKGEIHGTQPTIEIAKLILLDSAKIQEEDAERANLHGYSKHSPAKPLYTTKEAENVFPLFRNDLPKKWITIDSDISFRFRYNGHILGSTFIELKICEKLLVFSGDLGRQFDPLLFAPEKPEKADILFIESTYGNSIHKTKPKELLAEAIQKAFNKNGTIIIPSFAVERTQLLMYYLWELKNEKVIPNIPIYMDSPMGTNVLDIFKNNTSWHKLSHEVYTEICEDIKLVTSPQETYQLAINKKPKIIIAASGMASGGRVLTYFEHYLDDPNSTILLVGHQGEGTRGRALLEGAEEIKMRGKYWKVSAQIALIEGLSAHADQTELIDWMSELDKQPENIFIVHGEFESSLALKTCIKQEYNYESKVPIMNELVEIQI